MNDVATDVVYAGFWRRAGAFLLDGLILSLAFYVTLAIIVFAFAASGVGAGLDAGRPAAWVSALYLGILVLYFLAAALYYGLQESSVHQATVGKRALGIKVTDAQGQRLRRSHAIGRWFAAALSYLTLYIGFLLAAFTQRKQALHDLAAGTLVVDRWAYSEHPERQQRHVGALAVVLGLLLLAVPVLGILAAIAIPAYQDYVYRAKVMEALALTAPLHAKVEAFHAAQGRCPENGEDGFAAAESYAGIVQRIDVGTFEGDACGVQATIRSQVASEEPSRVWEVLGKDGAWRCGSDLKASQLPARCR